MYANQIMFTLGPGKRPLADQLAADFAPLLAQREGFQAVTFLADDEIGEYGALVVYSTKEDADSTFELLSPRLRQAIEEVTQEHPTRRLFEIVEAKES